MLYINILLIKIYPKPNIQYKTWINIPTDIPILVFNAFILPYLILWEVTIIKSGPGLITAKKWMIITDKNCSIVI